ncbi:hypothetical protein [uncultured Helicobacter sp.]|uniref:hypothetical protein n=1 Tax=uncultured Helicobacter sp. TaxID=175537 RepID=UPI00374E594F
MDILTLENPDLAKSKQLLCLGILGYIISAFCMSIPIIGNVMIFAVFVFWIIGIVGLYRFSKLANTFVFRYYMYSVLLNIGYYVILSVLVYGFIGIGDVMMLNTSVYVVSAICVFGGVAVMALQIYWFYKASAEMSFLTGLKAFVVSFKLYAVSLVGLVLLGVVFGFMFIDFLNHSPLLVSAAMFSGSEFLIIKFFENTSGAFMMGILFIMLFCIALASVVFLTIGFFGIQQTKVRPQIQLNADSQDSQDMS